MCLDLKSFISCEMTESVPSASDQTLMWSTMDLPNSLSKKPKSPAHYLREFRPFYKVIRVGEEVN